MSDVSQTTTPTPADYSPFEQRLAKAVNEEAHAPHEKVWAEEKWPVFLPHARAAIRALIGMGVLYWCELRGARGRLSKDAPDDGATPENPRP